MIIRKAFFLTLFLFVASQLVTAQIKGTIHLKADGTGDYPGLQQAFDALAAGGIDGPVTLSLSPGTYTGILETKAIAGASPANRITVTSSTGNAADVSLKTTLSTNVTFFFNIGHIVLRYTDYLTFRNLTVHTVYEHPLASAFTFFGGNTDIEIRDCRIISEGLASYGMFSPKYMDNDFQASTESPDGLLIEGCYIDGEINMGSLEEDNRTRRLILRNNDILTSFITISGLEEVSVLNNRIRIRPEESGLTLQLYRTFGKSVIAGNYLQSEYTGISATMIQGNLRIYNNFIVSARIGMDLGSDSTEVYYNNFLMYGSHSEKTAIQYSSGENNLFMNNNFVVEGAGSAISVMADPSENNTTFDYNNYWVPSGVLWKSLAENATGEFNQMEQIRQQFGVETHGLNIDPGYFSAEDLHVENSGLKGKALPIPGIETDYDGDERHPETPDIGADEMVLGANLALDTVMVSPLTAKGKAVITVSWKATNTGGVSFEAGWKDYVYLSEDDQLDANDIKLGERVHGQSLAMGASYEASFQYELERETAAQLYLIVVINGDGKLAEPQSDNLGVAGPLVYTARDKPSLFVTEILVPYEVPTGTGLNIRWVVTNQGELPTTSQWDDYVLISPDSVILQNPEHPDFKGLRVARVRSVSGLGTGESYTSSFTWSTPVTGSGKYYVRVIPDGGNLIDEGEENILSKSMLSHPVNLYQSPIADLVITSVSVPETAFSGDEIDLAYTVKNIGNAPTLRDRRYDDLYLLNDSTDTGNPARSHISYLRLEHNLEILPDSSVTILTRYRLPNCTSGKFFLEIHADATRQVDELSDDNNHFRSREIEVVLQPGPDLVIDQIAINPSAPVSGSRLTLNTG